MVRVELLSMPGCGHCEKAKEILEKLKQDFPNLVVEEINLLEHPEFAEKYFVTSSPGIVINGKLEFMGAVEEEELRKKLEEYKE